MDLVLRQADKHWGCENSPLASSCDVGGGERAGQQAWPVRFGNSAQQLMGEGPDLRIYNGILLGNEKE